MNTLDRMEFTEENIQKLFGHEAAENEDLERLKQYYFKNKVYDKIVANLPIRILVGHKGIGKSALFKVAMEEDREKGFLPILIQPNDLLRMESTDFLQMISLWEQGLMEIISNKVFESFGFNQNGTADTIKKVSGKLINFLTETAKGYYEQNISLEPAKRLLVENFLKNSKVIIYIDDLDRGWMSRKEDITRISALLNAIRDISSDNPGIYFRVALRTDVYFLVRTSDESTDKIESSVVWYSWTNQEILAMFIKRIETFFGRNIDNSILLTTPQKEMAKHLNSIMQPVFYGRGKWERVPIHKVLMSLIRKRPRDLVKLCTLAAKNAADNNSNIILTQHFQNIFEDYSQGRVQDTINEYRSELPDIERLIMGMKPNRLEKKASLGYVFTSNELLIKIKKITEQGKFYYSNGKTEASQKDLANFLYKINFLTAKKVLITGEIQRKYFEENRYLTGHFADFGYDWEIHPAYRWALQPDSIDSIFDQLDLTE
ncbi:hypothetical protein ABEO98_10280 [Brevibacillus parabrevis]|uniref:P-loop ATPase, Sll1717 family n=1 Tax=Brevibacillus parabrevis TaxID=54914 RepID=UPI002E1B58E5|nr:hypothetical protein [Brevibacillus parabrevis]